MSPRKPDARSEQRLDAIRAEASATGEVASRGIHPPGAPFPPTYYELPLLKPPVWTWEIPTYFFVGGAAGAASVIGLGAQLNKADPRLVRDARRIAAIGGFLSAPLLIADLGRPERFLNMLRVFKPQSAMSVGAWTLAIFGAASAAALLPRKLGDASAMIAALSGLGMATYTGVLLGATSIPVWSRYVSLLPIHFGASALGSAVSLLELRGHRREALNLLGAIAAVVEIFVSVAIEVDDDITSEPLRKGPSGLNSRIAAALSGPIPFALRLFASRSRRMREIAAVSTLLGSLLTRLAWVDAGKVSAADPRPPMSRSDAARSGEPVRK